MISFFKNKNLKTLSDSELVLKYQAAGNNEVLEEIFRRFTPLIYGACLNFLKNKINAEETVAEIYEKLWMQLRKNTNEIKDIKAWLFIITRNTCFKKLEKTQRLVFVEEYLVFPEVVTEDEEEKDKLKEYQVKMMLLLNELPQTQLTCIKLFYLENKSYKEIEEITSYTYNDIKSYIQNGKRKLKMLLDK